jgi:L-rhamnose mutarotase
MRIALHTRVHADRVADYERAHREVPAELTAAIVVHDYSADGAAAALPVVWQL